MISKAELATSHTMDDCRQVDINYLMQRLSIQESLKDDLIANSRNMSMIEGKLHYRNGHDRSYKVTEVFKDDLCEKLQINKRFYRTLELEQPDILDYVVTELLRRKDRPYMLRTFQAIDDQGLGVARCLRSPSFKLYDHQPCLKMTLKIIENLKKTFDVDIMMADLSDRNLFIRFDFPGLVQKADSILRSYRTPEGGMGTEIGVGFVFVNSEVGQGYWQVLPQVRVKVCTNGMIVTKLAPGFRKRHSGKRTLAGRHTINRVSQMELVKMGYQIHSNLLELSRSNVLSKTIQHIETKGLIPAKYPENVVQRVAQEIGFTQDDAGELQTIFEEGNDLTYWGVVQALTYYAQRVDNSNLHYNVEFRALELLDTMKKYDVKSKPTRRGTV